MKLRAVGSNEQPEQEVVFRLATQSGQVTLWARSGDGREIEILSFADYNGQLRLSIHNWSSVESALGLEIYKTQQGEWNTTGASEDIK